MCYEYDEGFHGGIFVFIDYLKNFLLSFLGCCQSIFSVQRKGGFSSNVFARENNFQACELGKHQSVVNVTCCLP